jgi:hypothetical protein
VGQIVYGLSTSAGMIGLIVSMVGGVLVTVLAMLIGVDGDASIWIGVAGGVIILAGLIAYALASIAREQARFVALFPTPSAEPVVEDQE